MSLVDLLDLAGLTGRGGAAFKTAIKIGAAQANGAELIVNVCDGEIGAAKDAWVVEHKLEELLYGVDQVTRREVRFATHRGSAAARRLRAARLNVLEVPDRYVSSEESAIVAFANGDLARPIAKRRPIAFGGALTSGTPTPPTVVLNAETVWRIAQISAFGPEWFRTFGTPAEPGPRLISVNGAVGRPGVVEGAAGLTLREIVARAGGPVDRVGSVNVSGLSGGWMTGGEAAAATWSNATLVKFGLSTGAGILHIFDTATCPLSVARTWLIYARGETAGQCGPCLFGVPAVVDGLLAIIDGRPTPNSHPTVLTDRLNELRGRGACRFPDGIGAFITSVRRTFGKLLEQHAHGSCPTGACAAADRARGNVRTLATAR